MKYSVADCQRIYDFFDKDFFLGEMGRKLGKCTITTDKSEAEKYFGVDIYDNDCGCSQYVNGKKFIYISKMLLVNKKYMANTILHEMIHLFDQRENPGTRRYRQGHGSYWTKLANYANSIYADKIGRIEMYADEKESEWQSHQMLMKKTKSLSNAYIVILRSRDLIPVKTLTNDQIEEIKKTDARAIFKVKPSREQSAKNRVKNYATFEMLMDDINYGISYEEEEMYKELDLKLGVDSERIWINQNEKSQ
jgi:hypothetical protein